MYSLGINTNLKAIVTDRAISPAHELVGQGAVRR
jgi:hypothetical protein